MKDWIEELGLQHLDHESGLFAVENTSSIQVDSKLGSSAASNCIYYALTREHPQNHLHWLETDDHHILIAGGPAIYYLFHEDGSVEKKTLGLNLQEGQRPIVVTPGGCGKAVRLHDSVDFLLVGSVVTPAWTPERVRFGGGPTFIDKYTGKADWATSEHLRSLIGPNWKADS
ncbi:MAG: cupin domain-containing protein [Opitutales bacterium]|jgi:uncharacterized protein|nr:cupin domain-containing protein [Opitutales bacterium]